jgi:hypothetical protein
VLITDTALTAAEPGSDRETTGELFMACRSFSLCARGLPGLPTARLLPAGAEVSDVGRALDTVKKHVGHVLAKLEADNRTQAVARARELGLIP